MCACGDGTRDGEVRGLRLRVVEAERAVAEVERRSLAVCRAVEQATRSAPISFDKASANSTRLGKDRDEACAAFPNPLAIEVDKPPGWFAKLLGEAQALSPAMPSAPPTARSRTSGHPWGRLGCWCFSMEDVRV